MPYNYLGAKVGVQVVYIAATGTYLLRNVSNSVSQSALTNVDNPEKMVGVVAESGYKGFYLSDDETERSPLDGTHKVFSDAGFPGHSTNQDSTILLLNYDDTALTTEILTMIFDVVSNEYPTHITINPAFFTGGMWNDYDFCSTVIFTTSTNDSPLIKMNIPPLDNYNSDYYDQPCNGIVITLTNNNNARAPIKVTHCDIAFTMYHKEDTVYSTKHSEQLFNTDYSFSPGLLQQYADIVFKDKDNIFSLLAAQDMLVENLDVAIDLQLRGHDPDPTAWYSFYSNYLHFITREWNISLENKNVSLSCKDATELFADIQAPYLTNLPSTLYDLLLDLFVNTIHQNLSIDYDTSTWMQSIKLDTTQPLQPSSISDRIQQICNAGLLTIFWQASMGTFTVRRCF